MELKDIPTEADQHINNGDHYAAQNNGPVRLLTARAVHPDGFIIPVEHAYSYSVSQCVKVTPETYSKFRERAEAEFRTWLDNFYGGRRTLT